MNYTPAQPEHAPNCARESCGKRIIITTGTFSTDAKKEASRDGASPVELVDGEKLIDMFEDIELGLKPKKAYEVDEVFFEEFRKG